MSEGAITPWRDPQGGAPADDDPARCTAHRSDGSGQRCGNWAMKGLNVCGAHGGRTPAAQRRAQMRLMDLLPVATKKHREILENSEDERVVLQAVKMVYDRTGLEEGSAAADQDAVKQLIVSKLLDMRGQLAPDAPLPPMEGDSEGDPQDIVDAEIVEEPDGMDLI